MYHCRMSWRLIQLLLCLVVALIAAIRLATGNIIGGLFSAAIAIVLFCWTTGYPLLTRLRRLYRLLRRGQDRG